MENTLNTKTNQRGRFLTITALIMTVVALLALLFDNILMTEKIEEIEPIISSQNNQIAQLSQPTETKPVCDVGTLCLQESKNESGIYGVAQITAHYGGMKTFVGMIGGDETCPVMVIDSTNDARILADLGENEINQDENGKPLFVISQEEADRFATVTSNQTPATLNVYISERVGRGTGPCFTRVHILN